MPPLILLRVEAVANPGIATSTSTYKLSGSIQYIHTRNVSILIPFCKFYRPHTLLLVFFFCLSVCCLFAFASSFFVQKRIVLSFFLTKNKVQCTKVNYSTIGQRWLLEPAAAAAAAADGDGDGSRQLLNCHCSENTRIRPATAREGVAAGAGADVAAGVEDELPRVEETVVAGDDDDEGLLMGAAERLESAPHPAMHIHCSSTSRWV